MPVQLIVLADVAGHGNDLGVVVVFLQPGDNDGSIQAAGICKNDLLDAALIHNKKPPMLLIVDD